MDITYLLKKTIEKIKELTVKPLSPIFSTLPSPLVSSLQYKDVQGSLLGEMLKNSPGLCIPSPSRYPKPLLLGISLKYRVSRSRAVPEILTL